MSQRSIPDTRELTPRTRERLALIFIALLPLVFYWRATLGLGMFYFGDIARFFYPMRLLYADALHAGRLPLWQPEILTGIPLVAEMQTGALYPPHLLLYTLLPIDLALNYDILLHLVWLAVGTFAFARSRRISIFGALIAALVLSLGGFGAARITHPNVLNVASWLPWLLWLYEVWHAGARRLLSWALLVLAFALQWLGGHPQFALINLVTFGAFIVGRAVLNKDGRYLRMDRQPALSIFVPFAALLLGSFIAAPQLLPTYEFSQQSARAGGVDPSFFTTFSFHPLYLALLGAPFLRGNPYPNTSVEVIAYVGILPLVLGASAVVLKRDRETLFWLLLAAGALLLAFGSYTPIYPALRFLPLFNLFRVPARFLFPFEFALAMLAALGFDGLRPRTMRLVQPHRTLVVAILSAILAGVILIVINLIPIEAWLDTWRALPIIFGGLALLLVLRATRVDRRFFAVSALGLTLLDVFAFSAVYAQTYNVIAPLAQVFPRPRVLEQLDLKDGARVLTSEWILPWTSVMNESLFPDLNAAHGVLAAGGYTPLTPRRTSDFLDNLSAVMLNKLSVRYYLIPQLLPVDPQTEASDVADPFIVDPIAAPLEFSPVDSTTIEIESSLSQSVNLQTGEVVAVIVLNDASGKEYRVPLRAGNDTAEWAYDRSDVQRIVKHARPEIASTFPARSAFPIENHVGHTYRANLKFADEPVPITRLRIEPKFPAGLIHIAGVALLNGTARIDLAPLLGKGQHHMVYRSEDVAVFENPDASPRAFITHNVRVATDDEAFQQLRSAQPNAEIYISEGYEFDSDLGQGLDEHADIISYEPERVIIDVQAASDGYLVLTDAWDPGWVALENGTTLPIARADVIFRAVRVSAGHHLLEFDYRPLSFYVGLVLSGIGLAILGIVCAGIVLVRLRAPSEVGELPANSIE